MLVGEKYRILDAIQEDFLSKIFLAQDMENRSFFLRKLSSDRISGSELTKLRYSFRKLIGIRGEGHLGHLEIVDDSNQSYLVTEAFQGRPLIQMTAALPFDVKTFLAVACNLARALGEFHSQEIVHHAINRSSIFVNFPGTDIKITHFAADSTSELILDSVYDPLVIREVLPYLSPEQTGRMNRAVDYRTDLYSLGVVFFELLLGQPPFNSKNPLELIHSHIAREPAHLTDLNPEIPKVLGNVVQKLLEKNAEDRYQNALGLAHDLDNIAAQLDRKSQIDGLNLFEKDISTKFELPRSLFGRETQINQILQAFDEVSQGSSQVLFVTGYAGVGKTSLIQDLQRPITEKKGIFLSSKYDHRTKTAPHNALIQSISQMLKYILSQPQDKITLWKAKLAYELGTDCALISSILPQFESILGGSLEIPETPTQDIQNQLNQALQKLVKALASKRQPLVISLDNVQWADWNSIELLKQLLFDGSIKHVLWLLAYRENEIEAAHPLNEIIEEVEHQKDRFHFIELPSLSEVQILRYSMDLLHCSPDRAGPLAKLLYLKTGGNPFFLGQFVTKLHDSGTISFVPDLGWSWDVEQIAGMEITDNVVELVAEKIAMLDDMTRQALELASCIGSHFLYTTLATVMDLSVDDVLDILSFAAHEGLIGQRKDEYFFLHDRIQEAAYNLIPAEERLQTHYRIAVILWARAGQDCLEDAVFEIVNQFVKSRQKINDPSEKVEIASLFLMAGRKSANASSFRDALEYLGTGFEILGDDPFARDRELAANFSRDIIEASYQVRDFDKLRQIADIHLSHVSDPVSRSRIYEVLIRSAQFDYSPTEALETGLRALEELQIRIPSKPSKFLVLFNYHRVKRRINKLGEEGLLSLPPLKDPRLQAAANIFSLMSVSAMYSSPLLRVQLIVKRAEIMVSRGRPSDAGVILADFATLLCSMQNKMDDGLRLGLLSRKFAEQHNDKRALMATSLTFHALIEPWSRHLANGLEEIFILSRSAAQIGAVEVTAPAVTFWEIFSLYSGKELSTLNKQLKENHRFLLKLHLKIQLSANVACQQIVHNLVEQGAPGAELKGAYFDGNKMREFFKETHNRLDIYINYVSQVFLASLFLDFEQACNYAIEAEQYEDSARSLQLGPIMAFYSTISFLRLASRLQGGSRRKSLRRARANSQKIALWNKHAGQNHFHRSMLIEAEFARFTGDVASALSGYEKAIDAALEEGYINEAGFAAELAGSYLREIGNKNMARFFLERARECYTKWGANNKVHHLEQQSADLLDSDDHAISAPGFKQLDYSVVVEAFQNISKEIEINRLLSEVITTLSNIAGANKVQFFMIREDGLYLEAEKSLKESGRENIRSTPTEDASNVFESVVNLVWRTYVPIVIDNAEKSAEYKLEPYVQEHGVKSLLCLPVLRKDEMVGIIYLENTVAEGAFTPDRIETIELLASQAAISVENASLYDELKQTLEDLVDSKDRLSLVLQGANLGMWDLDMQTDEVVYNERFADLHGLDKTQMLGNSQVLYMNVHPDDLQNTMKSIREHLNDFTPSYEMEYRVRRADGEWHWVFSTGRITNRSPNGEVLRAAGILLDIDPRKKAEDKRFQLERQVRQQQKMESIGQLAGGVAHDLNNLMTPILGYADLLREDYREDTALCDDLEEIRYAGKRAQDLIKQLLAFGRKQVLEWNVVDLNTVIEEFQRVLKRLIREDIDLEFKLEESASPIRADVSQLQQILLNLVVNARDALPGGGKISISTTQTIIDEKDGELVPGRYLSLHVRDNGTGMDEETKTRIFEPFFTTKEIGKGTGLGLATVYGIVKQHKGKIDIESEIAKGTCFQLYLPMLDSQEAPKYKLSSIPPGAYAGTETILVVEDEKSIRRFVASSLEKTGYNVILATSAEDALEYAADRKNKIDLLLTDIVMPKINGKEVYRQIKAVHPEMGVLFMSGYAHEDFVIDGINNPELSLISKPFTADELNRKIRESIETKEGMRLRSIGTIPPPHEPSSFT